MGKKLTEAGYPDMSSAVRPMALAPDERFVYFQVSFFHGFVEYDLKQDKVLRLAHLPLSDEAKNDAARAVPARLRAPRPRDEPGRARSCAPRARCRTTRRSSHRDDFKYKIVVVGTKPYWSTNSGDGRYCFVSFSGDDAIAAIDYATERRSRECRSATTRSGCAWAWCR